MMGNRGRSSGFQKGFSVYDDDDDTGVGRINTGITSSNRGRSFERANVSIPTESIYNFWFR